MHSNEKGKLSSLDPPNALDEESKNVLLNYLWKIEWNRINIIYNYEDTIEKIEELIADIKRARR